MLSPIFLYVELYCFAIAILLIIVWNICRQDHWYAYDQKIFMMLVCSNIAILIFEMMIRLLIGRQGNYVRLICIFLVVLYNILNPIICIIWYYYVDYYVYGDKERISLIRMPILIPLLINTLLSVASVFLNIYFVFDENNFYYKGKFIYILLGICLYIIVYTSVLLIRKREKINREEFYYLFFFSIPPSIAGIIQAFIPVSGISLIWIIVTLSVYIIFINIQKEQIYTDYLTGVNNRRYLDSFLHTAVKKHGCKPLACIMIDIDAFKMINDEHGHGRGDQALKYTVQILKNTFKETDFIARYGGDEFVVLTQVENMSELSELVHRLKERVSHFNRQKVVPYEINLSIGYDIYTKESGMSIKEFMYKIDQLLYIDKKSHKNISGLS